MGFAVKHVFSAADFGKVEVITFDGEFAAENDEGDLVFSGIAFPGGSVLKLNDAEAGQHHIVLTVFKDIGISLCGSGMDEQIIFIHGRNPFFSG